MKYLSRVADKMLQERLETFGAVLIEGPKWTGKTTTAEQQAKSVIKLQDPDKAEEYLTTAATKPSLLLKGEQPRLIDEWQDAPMIWDAVRTAVDNTRLLQSLRADNPYPCGGRFPVNNMSWEWITSNYYT